MAENSPEEGGEDDLLYDDLPTTQLPTVAASSSSIHAKKVVTGQNPAPQQSLFPALNNSSKKQAILEQESETLKRNIGTLYRTAKAELKRKDEEIARLLGEIERLQKQLK